MVGTIESEHSADAEVFFNTIMYCVRTEKFNENGTLSIKGEGITSIVSRQNPRTNSTAVRTTYVTYAKFVSHV